MAQSNTQNDVYKMESVPSGYCVIINMVNFDGNPEIERSHSFESVYLISKTLEYLNFKINCFKI